MSDTKLSDTLEATERDALKAECDKRELELQAQETFLKEAEAELAQVRAMRDAAWIELEKQTPSVAKAARLAALRECLSISVARFEEDGEDTQVVTEAIEVLINAEQAKGGAK